MSDLQYVAPMAIKAGLAQYGLVLSASGNLSTSPLPIWNSGQQYLTVEAHVFNMLDSYSHGNDVDDCEVTFWTLDDVGADISEIGPLTGMPPTSALGSSVPGGQLKLQAAFAIPLFLTTGKLIYGFRWTATGFIVAPTFVMTFINFN